MSEQLTDSSLGVFYREPPVDPVTGQVIKTDWYPHSEGSAVSSSEAELRAARGWEVEQDERGSYWAERSVPTPVIVDEYGIETGYELSDAQIDELARVTGEDTMLIRLAVVRHGFNLAQEGAEMIDNVSRKSLRDEREIAKLFKQNRRTVASIVRGVRSARNLRDAPAALIATPSYHTDQYSNQNVVFATPEEYVDAQRELNRQTNSGDGLEDEE